MQKLAWPGLILIFITMFSSSQFRELLGAITKWIAAVKLVRIRKDETTFTFDISHSDKVSKEDKDKVATELTQKRKEDYVYEDWHDATVIAYSEKRYEVALHDLSQALQDAKTKEQTAMALFNQGVVLGKLDRSEEAIRVYEEVNARYGKDTEPGG